MARRLDLDRQGLVSVQMPAATAKVIDDRVDAMVREECSRVNAHVPIRQVLERVARSAYLQGGVDAYAIFMKGEPK